MLPEIRLECWISSVRGFLLPVIKIWRHQQFSIGQTVQIKFNFFKKKKNTSDINWKTTFKHIEIHLNINMIGPSNFHVNLLKDTLSKSLLLCDRGNFFENCIRGSWTLKFEFNCFTNKKFEQLKFVVRMSPMSNGFMFA